MRSIRDSYSILLERALTRSKHWRRRRFDISELTESAEELTCELAQRAMIEDSHDMRTAVLEHVSEKSIDRELAGELDERLQERKRKLAMLATLLVKKNIKYSRLRLLSKDQIG